MFEAGVGAIEAGAAARVGQPIEVRTLKVTTETPQGKSEAAEAQGVVKEQAKNEGSAKAEDGKKDEVKSQSKENFEMERGLVDNFAIKLIRNAKIKAVSQNGEEAVALKQTMLEQRRQNLLNKLSMGGQIDIQDKELMGMLEYQFPPKGVIRKEGFNPVFEPRMSLTHLLDYYNQGDPTKIAEEGVPKLTPERRKQITEAATHLGLITNDGENGKLSESTLNIVKDIFKDSGLGEESFKQLASAAEKDIQDRLILTPKDFDSKEGFLANIGTGIEDIQTKIAMAELAKVDTKDIKKETSVLLKHQEVFMKYIKDAMQKIGDDYKKLINQTLSEKETTEWFNIFGPQVAGADQTVAIEKYLGDHDLLKTLKRSRIMTLTKGGGILMAMMSAMTAYGMFQVARKKEPGG